MRKKTILIASIVVLTIMLVSSSTVSARRGSGTSWDGETYTSFYDFFEDGYWEKRDDGWTLKLFPKSELRWSYISNRGANRAWQYIKAKFSYDFQWDNTESMRKQFMCHVHKAPLKKSWNIEPWRTDPGFNCN